VGKSTKRKERGNIVQQIENEMTFVLQEGENSQRLHACCGFPVYPGRQIH
jgi:hypothetical protein